jgi:hypothetical protein
VTEALDQGQVLVGMEKGLVLKQERLEVFHITGFDASDDLVVRKKLKFEVSIGEDLAVRDISHQKLNDDLKLQNLKSERFSSDLWALSLGLNQTSLSF